MAILHHSLYVSYILGRERADLGTKGLGSVQVGTDQTIRLNPVCVCIDTSVTRYDPRSNTWEGQDYVPSMAKGTGLRSMPPGSLPSTLG